MNPTLPSGWNGLMRLSLDSAAAYWMPTTNEPIDLGATVFTNAQLPKTIYLKGNGCGTGQASFSVVGLSDCVTNIPLQIFGVNATLAGVAETDELAPGGFLADRSVHTNTPRTALTLEAFGPIAATGNVVLTWNSSVLQIYTTASGGSPLTQFSRPYNGFTTTTLYVEGIAPGSNTLSWSYSEQTKCTDQINVTILKVDLSATDLDGAVADATEETTGAYVYWNLDNDDASDNTLGTPKRSGADYLQTGAAKVTDENDLKSLAMSLQPDLNQGSVMLNIASAKAKVWKDAEKGSANLLLAGPGDKTWNLADAGQKADFVSLCSSLWVEGVDSGTCDINLSYKDTSGTEICSDKVKYTFIAADCGRHPKTDPPNERNDAKSTFPNLVHCEWSITAEATPVYHCIAWSAGISDRWFEQVILIGGVSVADHWLGGVHYVGIDAKYGNSNGVFEIQADLDAFYAAEASVTPTATGPGDASVIYYDGYHGAKKKGCTCGSGKWIMFESKCGQWLRLEHVYDQLDGSTCGYGARTRYYK